MFYKSTSSMVKIDIKKFTQGTEFIEEDRYYLSYGQMLVI